MKIIIEGDANELAALVNEVNDNDVPKFSTSGQFVPSISVISDPKPTFEPDTNEIIAAFKKMTLARIKQLETYTGQDHCEVNAVRQCVEFITALELDGDGD